MECKKGVLLIACGHAYYGNYAIQLARSIKAVDSSIGIAVLHNGEGLSHALPNHKSIFDVIIDCPVYTTNGITDYMKTKAFIYDLSPFEETMYIDSDVIWLPQKPISKLFEELKDVKFTMNNRGRETIGKALPGYIHWAEPKKLIQKYKLSEESFLYNLSSEFIYFKKDKDVKKLFNEAKKIFDNPPNEFKKFGMGIADELAFEVAMMKTGVYPHAYPFLPFYWEQFERKSTPIYEIYKDFYAYSMGGNANIGQMANIYNNLAQHYNGKFGINGYFPAKDKKSWNSLRQTL